MICKSPAKINLSLQVLGKREDGYHDLRMIEIPLELHDVLEIEYLPYSPDPFIVFDDVALASMKSNLCKKAFEAMRKEYGFTKNFSITVHKEIPFAAGLGGGSSNAASVMLALNSLLHLRAKQEDLNRIGLTLGADVPFFLQNKPCLVEGIGEKLTPIKIKKNYLVLIVKPEAGLSTRNVFAIADDFPKAKIDTDAVIKALADGDDELLAKSLGNDLYLPAKHLLPDLLDIHNALKKAGFPIVSMSGSGSSMFALSTDARLCRDVAKKMAARGYIVKLTKIVK